jgi:hypothetical protein
VRLEPSLQIALDEADEKLHFIRYGEQRRFSPERSPQTLLDAGDEFSKLPPPVSRPSDPPQNTLPVSVQVREEMRSPPESSRWRNSERKAHREPSSLPDAAASSPKAAPLPAQAPSSGSDPTGDDEIPVPDLDPDGRVVSLRPHGLDEWDRLSDSEEEEAELVGQVRRSKPFVDVHEFLRSVSVREQREETGSERSSDEEEDDESASVY